MKEHATSGPKQQLRAERLRRQWSQQAVADRIGTSVVTINRWERGVTTPSPYYRLKLCALFGKSAIELGLLPDETKLSDVEASSLPSHEILSPPSSSQQSSSRWHLPFRRNPFFTGREPVLTHLHSLLHAHSIQAHALSGLAGIGKTQTAIEYAYRFRSNYLATLWMRAETRELLTSECLTLARKLGLPQKDGPEQTIEAVRQWLGEHHGWLLILDNVEDISLVEDFLPTFLNGHVLLTTRTQAIGPLAQHTDLKQMTVEEGTILLLRRCKLLPPDGEVSTITRGIVGTAATISETLDGLPLALDQAGAYIEETGCSLEDYLERYHRHRMALLDRRGGNNTEHPASVVATISLCIERVAQRDPAAVDLLRCCAFLHPDSISEELLSKGASALGPALAAVVSNAFALDTAVASLRTLSLLYRNAASRQLTIHRVVQAVLKDLMEDDIQRQWAERIVRAISLAFPEEESIDAVQQCERFLPQVYVCAELIAQWKFVFLEAGYLLHNAGRYLIRRGQYTDAESFLHKALGICQSDLEVKDSTIASILNSLGVVYEAQGKYAQAEAAYRQALTLQEKMLAPEHPDILETLSNVGRLNLQQGYYAQAGPVLEQVLLLREQYLGRDHPQLVPSLHLVATLYQRQGTYAQAEVLLQQAVIISQKTFGEAHPSTIERLSSLAMLYHMQGKYTQAKDVHQHTIALIAKANGSSYYHTVPSLRSLGLMYSLQGEYSQAEALLRQAVAICRRTFGNTHPETAESLKSLGILFRMQGRYEQAEDILQRASDVYTNVFGTSHPETAETFSALGIVYGLQGNYAQAEALLQQSIEVFTSIFGHSHPDTAESLCALGVVYSLQNKYTQAEDVLEQALSIREQVLGKEHPDVAKNRELLAKLSTENRG